jgi:hypothetical protein
VQFRRQAEPKGRLAAGQAGHGEAARTHRRVPGDAVTAITLTAAPDDTTQVSYAFDVDESMHAVVTASVDDVLGRLSAVLAAIR